MEKDREENGTILIVDDEPANISLLSKSLRDHYKTKAATDGKKAIRIASSSADERPDLILLDIMMPSMDGYEVCRHLKSNEETKEIPVIFLSGMNSLMDEAKGLMLGAVDFITKPIDPLTVKARIRVHLRLAENCKNRERELLQRIEHLEAENAQLKGRQAE